MFDVTFFVRPSKIKGKEKENEIVFYLQNYFSAWDQTDKFVKIYLTSLSGLDQLANESIKTEFTDNSLSVRSVGQVISTAPSCCGWFF
jgi:hypothetical protein